MNYATLGNRFNFAGSCFLYGTNKSHSEPILELPIGSYQNLADGSHVVPPLILQIEIVPEGERDLLKPSGLGTVSSGIRTLVSLPGWGSSSLTMGAGSAGDSIYTELYSS